MEFGGESISPRRILVVDDNVNAAETLALILRMMDHEVRVAYDGPTALKMARSCCPEVVLLDIGLPGMDGIEVGRRLRSEHSRDALLMLAALTGYGSEEDRRQCAENGFDVHLTKPIEPALLLEILAGVGHDCLAAR